MERRPRNGLQKSIIRKIELFIDKNDDDDDNEVQKLPKLGDKRRNCTACLDDIAGPQYKQKKPTLPKNKTQCQTCGVPCCPTHLTYVCGKHISRTFDCIISLYFRTRISTFLVTLNFLLCVRGVCVPMNYRSTLRTPIGAGGGGILDLFFTPAFV